MKYKAKRQFKRGNNYYVSYDVLDDENKLIVGDIEHCVGKENITNLTTIKFPDFLINEIDVDSLDNQENRNLIDEKNRIKVEIKRQDNPTILSISNTIGGNTDFIKYLIDILKK